jgi:hypothetical protein
MKASQRHTATQRYYATSDGAFSPDIARRALIAFLRTSKTPRGEEFEAPDVLGVQVDDMRYVAITRKRKIVAVYRVRKDLQLKRLKRFPSIVLTLAQGGKFGEHERK